MALLDIRTWPDPALSRPAAPAGEVDDELRRVLDDMAETMYAGAGIGLAGPQVGVSRRVLVVDVGEGEDFQATGLLAFVDPEIVEASGRIVWEEGYLSFPGLTVDLERAERVRARARDARGRAFEVEWSGLPAVCIQHEIDHLDGVTIVDRLSRLQRHRALARYKRLRAEQADNES